jgi:hypothetical protein
MPSKNIIFISYSRKDERFVTKLKLDLNNYGITTWIDLEQIKPGSMWQEEIKNGIQKSGIIIVVLSKNYFSSSWGSIEIALSFNKTILPIKIDDELSINIPPPIKNLQWIDFFEQYNIGLDKLINAIPNNYKSKNPVKANKSRTQGYVFLSFCDEDRSFIIKLRNFLKSQQFAYWDYEEGERNYLTQFFLELEAVIDDSEAVLSIISPDWKRSKWAVREFVYSEDIGKPVFLLRAKETKPILAISGTPYIDFVINENRGFEKLERELRKRLK